jgi:hypothetical protein
MHIGSRMMPTPSTGCALWLPLSSRRLSPVSAARAVMSSLSRRGRDRDRLARWGMAASDCSGPYSAPGLLQQSVDPARYQPAVP